MHCYWTGELKLGAIEGVVKTEAGWYGGREVTLVTYHTGEISLTGLMKQASDIQCADSVYVPATKLAVANKQKGLKVGELRNGYRKAKASDQKKQMESTPYAKLKLTPAQATKVNAYARVDTAKAMSYLTKKQKEQLNSY